MLGRKPKQQISTRQSRLPQRTVNREFFSYHTSKQNTVERDSSVRQRLDTQSENVSKNNWQKLPMLIALVALIVSIGYATILVSDVRVQAVNSDVLLQDEKIYSDATKKILQSSANYKNKLTINTTEIEKKLLQEFPELSDVSITIPLLGKKPIIEVRTEKPLLLLANNNGVYALNEKGRIVASSTENNNLQDLVLPILREESNFPLEAGKGALTEQEVVFITSLIKQYDQKALEIESLVLPPLASELHVKTKDASYFVKYNLLTDSRISTGQYFAAKKKFEAINDTPREYVDVRVEEKVFIK
jgi:hypothetical protein